MLRVLEEAPGHVPAPVKTRRPRPAARVRVSRAERAARAEGVVLCAGIYRGGPAILGVTRSGVFVCSLPAGETRMRSIAIRQVLAVEEDVRGGLADVTVLAAHATITLTEVPRARAWEFTRAAREAVLAQSA